MKKIIFAIFTVALLGAGGCNDWLTVKPRTETPAEDMFSSEEGFRKVMTGAYIRMRDNALYGGDMMWGMVELIGQHWNNLAPGTDLETTNGLLVEFNYTNEKVVARIDHTYEMLYKVVMDVNGLLEVIDDKQNLFSDGGYELIKGEALGLRAFIHLDLMRLFGPMPMTENIGAQQLLPYVKTVDIDDHFPITYQQYAAEIEKDIEESLRLLEGVDPILSNSIAELNPRGAALLEYNDTSRLFRQVTMNYWAVKALQARFLLWIGGDANLARARECAIEVIEATDPHGEKMFRLGNSADITARDYSFSKEHICAIDYTKLDEKAADVFEGNNSTDDVDLLVRETAYLGAYYYPNTSDIRHTARMWAQSTSRSGMSYSLKFMQVADPNSQVNQIPLLRLAEMYMIAIEGSASPEEAKPFMNEFYGSRGLAAPAAATTIAAVRTEIQKEYQRELIAEGQGFFAYKRVSAPYSIEYVTLTPARYRLPIPVRDQKFNE